MPRSTARSTTSWLPIPAPPNEMSDISTPGLAERAVASDSRSLPRGVDASRVRRRLLEEEQVRRVSPRGVRGRSDTTGGGDRRRAGEHVVCA